MKPLSIIKTVVAALLLGTVSAFGTPPDNAAPESGGNTKPVDPKPAAFLGVVTAPISKIITEQLGLPAGQGIAIHALAPQGPAAKAGLAVNDIITRINGLNLGAPADLTKVLANQKPGDSVHLTLIQKGNPAEYDVTLDARPAGMGPARSIPLDAMLKDLANGTGSEKADGILRFETPAAGDTPGNDGMEIQIGSSIHMMDAQGSVEMKSNKKNREITMRDKANKVTWSGPWNTEEDKKAAPPEVALRLKDLNLEKIFDSSRVMLNLSGGKPQEKSPQEK
ncbi:MAG: PDZ domain-containing protein [Verrucomicrobiota bacterium]